MATIATAVTAGRLIGEANIGIRIGEVIGKYKMAKHYQLEITNTTFSYTRDQAGIQAEAALDAIYVIRTSVPATQMDAAQVVATYKSLAHVERDFRSLKTIDLDLRPIHHYTATRAKAHVLLCTLAAYLVWHLRQAWVPLTFTDQDRPQPTDPLAPARRPSAARRKAATKTTDDDLPARSFTRSLLAALIHSANCSTDGLGATPQPSDGTTTGQVTLARSPACRSPSRAAGATPGAAVG